MSNEQKWTPGPWHSRGYPTISAGKGKGMVAKVLERYMDRAEREANAHLIAAAPELFDACLDLLAWHDALADPLWHGSPSQTKAIAALAKANGGGER